MHDLGDQGKEEVDSLLSRLESREPVEVDQRLTVLTTGVTYVLGPR